VYEGAPPLVSCPRRGGNAIAIQRCAEFQTQHGCGTTCTNPHRAGGSPEARLVGEAIEAIAIDEARRGPDDFPCVVCTDGKVSKPGKTCIRCRWERGASFARIFRG
jgi:hypothetical protein